MPSGWKTKNRGKLITEYIEIFYNRIRKQTPIIYLSPGTFKQ
jgi:hypothetical protein